MTTPTRGRVISEELRTWRAERGISQITAAAELCVPVRTLQGWEAGRPCALADAVLRLAELLPRTGAAPEEEPAPAPSGRARYFAELGGGGLAESRTRPCETIRQARAWAESYGSRAAWCLVRDAAGRTVARHQHSAAAGRWLRASI